MLVMGTVVIRPSSAAVRVPDLFPGIRSLVVLGAIGFNYVLLSYAGTPSKSLSSSGEARAQSSARRLPGALTACRRLAS